MEWVFRELWSQAVPTPEAGVLARGLCARAVPTTGVHGVGGRLPKVRLGVVERDDISRNKMW